MESKTVDTESSSGRKDFCHIACGSKHTLILAANGDVYGAGDNKSVSPFPQLIFFTSYILPLQSFTSSFIMSHIYYRTCIVYSLPPYNPMQFLTDTLS